MRLARYAAGEGGTPLVLLHGVGSSHRCWVHVVDALSPSRRVIAVDMPGFGRSEPLDDGFEPDAVADAIVSGLAEAGGPFDLVGHSLGGVVATVLASRHADRVRHLVLVAPAGLGMRFAPAVARLGPVAAQLTALRRTVGRGLEARSRARVLMFRSVVADPAALSPADARVLLEASSGARRIAAGVATAATSDIAPLVRDLPMPVGLIWGTADPLLPASGASVLAGARPSLRVERLDGLGHLPMIEDPTAFVSALTRILAESA